MATPSDVFDPAQLDVCDRWKVRIAPLIESLGGVHPTLLQAGAMLLNMDDLPDLPAIRRAQGMAWLIASTAHLIDERAFLADIKELHHGSVLVRDVVCLCSSPADEPFDMPITIILPPAKAGQALELELIWDSHTIITGNWAAIKLVGPDVGEAFVQVPNGRDVPRVVRGNVSTTLDGRTWTGTNPLKEPA